MKSYRSCFPLVFFLFLALFSSHPQTTTAAGLVVDTKQPAVTVVMTGSAAASEPDRERIARRRAIQDAVRYVIGEEVKSETLVTDFMLVYDRIFTKTKGFVKKVTPKGKPTIADGIFQQEYSLEVSTLELDKALVETGIEAQIDIPALYQTIDKPRIAMVIREVVIDEQGKKTTHEPDLHAESILQTFFKKRNSEFSFKSLPFLTASAKNKPDWVALGRKNNFDIVIIGDINTTFLLKTVKNIRGVGKNIQIPMYRYSSELTWNIVNISRAERISTIHELFDKGDKKSGSSPASAKKYAKDQVLRAAVPKLFSQLMLSWVDTAYYSPYELIFAQTSADEDFTIHTKLRQIEVIASEKIYSRGSIDGRLVYEARINGTLSELTRALGTTFPEYELGESRHGRVVMIKSGTEQFVHALHIDGLSFLQSDTLFKQLQALPGVNNVSEPLLSNSRASYRITTRMTERELAMQLEKVIKLRVTDLGQQSIQAKMP